MVDLDVRYYPYVDRKGAIAGVVVHARDTTKALRSANALRMNEERLNAMVELYRKTPELSESEILTFTDADANILAVNRAFSRLPGIARVK